jgi:hypothetical protein
MRAPEDIDEGQRPRAARAVSQTRPGIETMPGEKAQHRRVIDEPALVGDVIADQRDAIIPGEQQSTLRDLEVTAQGVVLHERRQARLAEQRARSFWMIRKEAPDRDRQGRLVTKHPRVGRTVQGGRVPAQIGRADPLQDQCPPFLAEDLPGSTDPHAITRPWHAAGPTGVDDIL